MKPFRFRLEALLTLRQRAEDQAGEALAYAEDRRGKAEAALAKGEVALEELDGALLGQRQARISCRDHLLMLQNMEWQKRECGRLSHVLAQSQAEVECKRADMVVARREREVVARLKEKQLAEHRLELRRREEAEISDLVGARHALRVAEAALTGDAVLF